MNKGSDGNGKGKGKTVSPPLTAGEKLEPQMAKLGVGSCRSSAIQPGSSAPHGSVQMCSSQDWDFVPETQGTGLLIVEEMEFYLLRACHKLQCGLPYMETRVVFDNYGQKLFAFKAGLHCDEKEIEVYAESCYCPDEARAREDVAFKILDKLLIQTGHSIRDFNYRKLCVA
ncbi:hypothetical protein PIB30_016848 [Stylosanthes scabra]|uniref:Uncharacterized protein n=1 Tax=Stylosanthes scabra TaxID=79078 RepID=A0ABU6T763_9FABA|nr:hypothetical protein [Stylosanthes scabra]